MRVTCRNMGAPDSLFKKKIFYCFYYKKDDESQFFWVTAETRNVAGAMILFCWM